MSTVNSDTAPTQRMRAEDRRELILEAATRVFGERGYVGATTLEIARAADVSQPYVVRMFGTKENLFLEVLQRALDLLFTTFEHALEPHPSSTIARRLGRGYVELAGNRGVLLSLMHAFCLGSDPVIGPAARAGFMKVYRFLRDRAGMSAIESQEFLSGGMMINTMIGLRMSDDFETDDGVRELLEQCFPEKLDLIRSVGEPLNDRRTR